MASKFLLNLCTLTVKHFHTSLYNNFMQEYSLGVMPLNVPG